MDVEIVTMTLRHHAAVARLWEATVGLDESDSRANVARYLRRNRRLSVVARQGGRVVGALLAGHDGRRGILHHLAVAPQARGAGVGKALVAAALRNLRAAGIFRCWILILTDNASGRAFWKRLDWQESPDVVFAWRNC